MDALGGVVGDELGGGIAGMELDLVDGGDDLGARVSIIGQESERHKNKIEIKQGKKKERDANLTLHDSSFNNLSKFLIPKFETPIFLTFPVPTNFCISLHVSTKSHPSRCFFKSVGSVLLGQCMRYKST